MTFEEYQALDEMDKMRVRLEQMRAIAAVPGVEVIQGPNGDAVDGDAATHRRFVRPAQKRISSRFLKTSGGLFLDVKVVEVRGMPSGELRAMKYVRQSKKGAGVKLGLKELNKRAATANRGADNKKRA